MNMKTDALIALLTQDARLRTRFGTTLLKAAVVGAALAALAFVAMLAPRPDLGEVAGTARFLFKFAVTVPLAVVGIGLTDRLARPAAPAGVWPWLLAGVAFVLAVGIGLELSAAPASEWTSRLVGVNARSCVFFIPLIAIGPLACLLAALGRGAPSHSGLSGAVAGLAAGGIAAALYATHCPDDSPLFVATWYSIAIGFVVVFGFLAGRRLLVH